MLGVTGHRTAYRHAVRRRRRSLSFHGYETPSSGVTRYTGVLSSTSGTCQTVMGFHGNNYYLRNWLMPVEYTPDCVPCPPSPAHKGTRSKPGALFTKADTCCFEYSKARSIESKLSKLKLQWNRCHMSLLGKPNVALSN